MPAVDVQGALLAGSSAASSLAHPSRAREACRPVTAAHVDHALLDVAERDEQAVVDARSPGPRVVQHRQRRAEAADLELGPRPGDEYPDPSRPRIVASGPVEDADGLVERGDGIVEAAHLVGVPRRGEEGVRDAERVLDGGLLQLDGRGDDRRCAGVAPPPQHEVDQPALDGREGEATLVVDHGGAGASALAQLDLDVALTDPADDVGPRRGPCSMLTMTLRPSLAKVTVSARS